MSMAISEHLNKFYDEVGKDELMTKEQERALSERILAGDERAVGQLVKANMCFVMTLAREYQGQGVELEDLISEGSIGLLKAARKFDASKGARFVSFAAAAVRQQMERAVKPQETVSVDAPFGRRSNMNLLSVLVNNDSAPADKRTYSEATVHAIEQALPLLNEREQEVVRGFFGIGQEHETMAEIALRMGLKRERVRQIRDKAVRKMRSLTKDQII